MPSLEQQTDKQFLLIESQLNQNSDKEKGLLNLNKCNRFWSDRIVLIEGEGSDEFWNFIAFDLLMSESRQIRFRKTSENFKDFYFYPMDGKFAFIVEYYNDGFQVYYNINLVRINWNAYEFEVIEKFEKQCEYFYILVDKLDTSKFVLWWKNQNEEANNYQLCKSVNGKIGMGEIYQFRDEFFNVYSKDRLIGVRKYLTDIAVYDFVSKKIQIFEIDMSLLFENVKVDDYEWVNERLYIKFKNTQKQGIAWANLTTKQWNLVDFKTILEIYRLEFLNGNLGVATSHSDEKNDNHLSNVKYFSIPVKKPNYLRYSTWLLVVKIMKNKKEKDPYKAAKEFLPLNSDLRELWFKDEEMKMGQMKI